MIEKQYKLLMLCYHDQLLPLYHLAYLEDQRNLKIYNKNIKKILKKKNIYPLYRYPLIK